MEDSWAMVPLFQKVGHHSLAISDLWHQHNEHRIFFPLLLLLANAYATHWNTVAEILIGFAFSIVSIGLILAMLRRSLGNTRLGIVASALVAAWFFSPIQWENWTWGWQLEWFMCVAGFIVSTFLLLSFLETRGATKRRTLLVLAAVAAFVSTFSLASGIFTWLIGALILAVSKQRIKTTIIWVAAGLASAALYYYHYIPGVTPEGSQPKVLVHNPVGFFKFILAYLGGMIGPSNKELHVAYMAGAFLIFCLLLMLYLVWQRRNKLKPYLPWLALIAMGILCAASTAYGRLGFGVMSSLSSRYTAFSLLYLIGLIGLAFSLILNSRLGARSRQLYVWGIALLCIPLLISSYRTGIQGFKEQNAKEVVVRTCTHQADPSDACLLATYPSAKIVRLRLEYLKAKHWAGY
jgi:hypothetical protein